VGVDLDQPLGPRQGLNHEAGGDRVHAPDVLTHGAVHGLAVTDVGDVDHQLHQVLHRAAALLDELPNVLHDLVGLLGASWLSMVLAVSRSCGHCPRRYTVRPPRVTTAWHRSLSSLCSGYVSLVLNLRMRVCAISVSNEPGSRLPLPGQRWIDHRTSLPGPGPCRAAVAS
jgi:hypothetical protein